MPLPSLSTIAASLVGAYILSYIYAFIRNALNARKTGLPSIYVPVHQQNFLWMIISPPLRGWFEARLSTRLFNRLTLTIYGWKFFQRLKPLMITMARRRI